MNGTSGQNTPRLPAQLLNFVVVGDIRSGTTVVQSSISNRGGAVCHGNLFHPDAKARRKAHEEYFGACAEPEQSPEWFVENETIPFQYINCIMNRPRFGEQAIGLRVLYDVVQRWEMWEMFETRFREGDFCIVHVLRNPVACFISRQQALQSNIWTRSQYGAAAALTCPRPVRLDMTDLVEFCRRHAAMRRRLKTSCPDCLEVQYRDLFIDYDGVMHRVFDFLELPYSELAALPGCRRLWNRSLRDRVDRFDLMYAEAPHEIRAYLDAEDLF